jgi:hypothetical protein
VPIDSARAAAVRGGLIALQQRRQLYFEEPTGVEITDGVLYRARIDIPARVPVGEYTAETFLIRNGEVAAAAVREIRIEKLGFERFVAAVAEEWSLCLWHRCRHGLAAARLGGERGVPAGIGGGAGETQTACLPLWSSWESRTKRNPGDFLPP